MPRFSAHLGYMFTEHPLRDRFAAARRAGFPAVEHPSPYAIPAAELCALLDAEGLAFVQFALPAGAGKGEKGFAAIPGREAEFLASVDAGLDYAAEAGAQFVQLQSGVIPPGADTSRLWDTYVGNLRAATAQAAERGLTVLIEPIGAATIAGYFMDRSDLALRALDEAGAPNARLLFDVFHSTVAGVDPVGFVRAHAGRIGHLHIADHPGRHQPGTGTIDFSALFAAVGQVGYAGFIGCEYIPDGSTEGSLGWYAPYRNDHADALHDPDAGTEGSER